MVDIGERINKYIGCQVEIHKAEESGFLRGKISSISVSGNSLGMMLAWHVRYEDRPVSVDYTEMAHAADITELEAIGLGKDSLYLHLPKQRELIYFFSNDDFPDIDPEKVEKNMKKE